MKTLMKKLTSQAQTPLLSIISKITPKLNSTRFYISNVIFMKDVDYTVINYLAATTPGEFLIREPQTVVLDQMDPSKIGNISSSFHSQPQ